MNGKVAPQGTARLPSEVECGQSGPTAASASPSARHDELLRTRQTAMEACEAIPDLGFIVKTETNRSIRDEVLARIDEALTCLRDADQCYSDDRETALWAAEGAFDAIGIWGHLAQTETERPGRDEFATKMDEALGHLNDIEHRFPDDPEITLWAANGAYQAAKTWHHLADSELTFDAQIARERSRARRSRTSTRTAEASVEPGPIIPLAQFVQNAYEACASDERKALLDENVTTAVEAAHAGLPVIADETAMPLPTVAPKLWRRRSQWQMSPADFIMEVYGPWLGRLTLSDLRDLDPQLATRYSNWVSAGNEPPEGLNLPTLLEIRSRTRARRKIADAKVTQT